MTWKVMFGEIRTREGQDDEGNPIVERYSDVEVALDDLSPDVFEQIARTEPGLSFWEVYRSPGENPERLHRILCAAADFAKVPQPERAESMRAIDAQSEMFGRTQSIEEQPMMNGFPQVPGEPESGSTSGVPGDSDGPEPSAETSP